MVTGCYGVGSERLGVEGDARGRLEGGERAPGVTAGDPDEVRAGVLVQREAAGQPALVGNGGVDQVGDLVVVERGQRDEDRAGEKRGDDAERRVLGGGRDEDDEPVLHAGQQRVLLGLGEPVDLIEEEHRLAVVQVAVATSLVHDLADVLDAGRHGGQLDEPPVRGAGDKVGQGGLAGTGRSPDDRRERAGRAAVGVPPACGGPLDQAAQRAAGTQHVGLAPHLLQRARAHPDGERREGAVAGRRGASRDPVVPGLGEQVRSIAHRDPA